MSEPKHVTQGAGPRGPRAGLPHPTTARLDGSALLAGGVLVVVALAVTWHVHVQVAPPVIFHGDLVELPGQRCFVIVPMFVTGSDFFAPFLSRPGGLAEWSGAWLTQYFSAPPAGTIILVVLAGIVCLAVNRIASAAGGRPVRYLGLLPALIWVALWGHYVFHLGDMVAVCVALVGCVLYTRLRRLRSRAVALTAGTFVLYYAIGSPAMLFAVLCGLVELLRGRQWRLAMLALLAGAAAPAAVGIGLLGDSPTVVYMRLSGLCHHWERLDQDLAYWTRMVLWFSFYGVCVLVVGVGRWVAQRAPVRAEESPDAPKRLKVAAAVARPAGALALTGIVLFGLFDARSSSLLRIHYHAMQDQWQQVLDEADRCPQSSYPSQAIRHINRALFERGRLSTKMFAYPQAPWGLFAPEVHSYQSAAQPRMLLRMGMVNKAEHVALELLERWGPRPTLLRVLARIYIVKGETAAAKVFLTNLTRDVVYGDWAQATLNELARDPLLSDDPEIGRIRSVMLATDRFDRGYQASLLDLLQEGEGRDPMPFEYLMAAYLLHLPTEGPDRLAGHFDAMMSLMAQCFANDKGRYLALPEHYAEAAVMHAALTGRQARIGSFVPSRETFARFKRSVEIMRAYGRNIGAADARLAAEMPHSFFRYASTGRSGGPPCE